MKQIRHLYLYLLTALLSVTASLPLAAQQAQDALYIFRNDGQFNAFFWGDIERIDYSRVDTFGIERHDYVVQEIYALDSIFRIPLSAIDSVSFVTPETKYKKDVVRPDKTIADYIVASDSLYWIRLALNTPKELLPRKGDKLLIEEPSRYIPDGFGGLVTSVTEGADGYTVSTEELALKDVYDVLVLKNSGLIESEAESRRASSDADFSYETKDPLHLPAMSVGISLLAGQHKMTEDGTPIQVSLDGSLDLSGTLQSDVDLRCFLYLNTLYNQDRYYQIAKFKNSIDISLALTGALTAHADLPFTFAKDLVKEGGKMALKEAGKKLAVDAGPFWVDFSFGLYIEGQGTVSSSYTWSNKHDLNTTYQYDREVSSGDWEDFYHYSIHNSRDTTTWTFAAGKFAVSAGIYGQAEVACNVPIVKKKGSAALRLDAGLKAEFDVPIFGEEDYAAMAAKPSPNLYKLLNFEENVTLSTPVNLSFALNAGKWAWTPKLSFSLLKPITRGIVPNITGITVAQDKEEPLRPYRYLLAAPLKERKLLLGKNIGFAIYNEEGKLVTDTISDYYLSNATCTDTGWKKDGLYRCVMTNIDPAKGKETTYTAYPIVKYSEHNLLVDKKKTFVVDSARIDIETHQIDDIPGKGGMKDIEVVPNMSNVDVKSEAEPWLTCIWLDHKNQLSVYYKELPKGIVGRRGVIRLTGKTQKGEVLVRDSIVVNQGGGYIALHPDKLTFTKQGGTKTVTIDSTNVKQIIIRETPKGISATLEGNTLTITAAKNDDYKYTDFVILEGETDDGQKGSAMITIIQDGKDPDHPETGESIDVETFKCSVGVGGMKRVACSDPDIEWDRGFGPSPGGWGIGYNTAETTQKWVNATLGNNAIHFVVHAINDEYTSYRDVMSAVYDGVPVAGKRTYTLTFDIEKYLDDDGKPAARVTNMSMNYDSRETWPKNPDFGFYEDYEQHHISANVDPSEVKTKINTASSFVFENGQLKYKTTGYSGITIAGSSEFYSDWPYEGEEVRVSNYDYDFAYHYYYNNGRVKEWRDYSASYKRQDQSAKNSIFLKVTFPEEVQKELMEWFEK